LPKQAGSQIASGRAVKEHLFLSRVKSHQKMPLDGLQTQQDRSYLHSWDFGNSLFISNTKKQRTAARLFKQYHNTIQSVKAVRFGKGSLPFLDLFAIAVQNSLGNVGRL